MKIRVVITFIVLALTINIFSQVEFVPHTITISAYYAFSVYAVDVDSDGDMDVLSASSFDNKIAWYENLSPVPGDLVAHYPFNGNANDESGNNLHLTAVGSPTLSLDRFGNSDSSYYFDGLNDFFIHNYDTLLTPTNEITVNVWVKHSEIDGESDVVISTLDLPDVGGYQIDISNTGTEEVISWDIRPSGGNIFIRIPYEQQWNGIWTMITGTFNQDVMKLFVNGELKDSLITNTTINYETTNDFRIATNPHADNEQRRYKGYIDDVSIYNRALTDEEVLNLYDITVPVELTSFTATIDHNTVILNWQTETETNNLGFEIERFTDESEWKRFGFVEGHGTTTETKSYQYIDNISLINATSVKYRLKQIDFDGSYEYSKVVEVSNLLPTNFALVQNYPNPFNPTTVISYSLPIKSFVTIKIYNALGEEVRDLLNEEKVAGDHRIKFDATGLPSGIYMYRIQAGNFIETKKMVLMK